MLQAKLTVGMAGKGWLHEAWCMLSSNADRLQVRVPQDQAAHPAGKAPPAARLPSHPRLLQRQHCSTSHIINLTGAQHVEPALSYASHGIPPWVHTRAPQGLYS